MGRFRRSMRFARVGHSFGLMFLFAMAVPGGRIELTIHKGARFWEGLGNDIRRLHCSAAFFLVRHVDIFEKCTGQACELASSYFIFHAGFMGLFQWYALPALRVRPCAVLPVKTARHV